VIIFHHRRFRTINCTSAWRLYWCSRFSSDNRKVYLNKNMFKRILGSVTLFFFKFVATVSIRKEFMKNKMSCLFGFCLLTCLSFGMICYQIHLGRIALHYPNYFFDSFCDNKLVFSAAAQSLRLSKDRRLVLLA
jgi:hypothetical protein